MVQVEGAGVPLEVIERGAGPAVLAVHAIASDALAWQPALDAIAAAGARAIAYDRRGYGRSGAPEPYAATSVQEQAQDTAAVLERLDAAPALVCGDGFGALIALELLVRRPQLVAAAVLAEPPLFAFVPAATEALAAQRDLLEEAIRDGGPPAAIDAWLGPRGDVSLRERLRASPRGFFADYAGLASWSPSRRELRAVGIPVAFVTGPGSGAHLVAAADAAAALVPGARRITDGDIVAATIALLSAVAR